MAKALDWRSIGVAVSKDESLGPIDWAELPAEIRVLRYEVPSGELAAIEAGNPANPCVILIPGVTGSKEDFQRMMPLFVEAGYFVISYDLAGQYESRDAGPWNRTPAQDRYTLDLYVDDLFAVLERHSGHPVHALGYSFGGNILQEAFSREPQRFASLTFLSAPPIPGQAFRAVKRIGWISRITNGRIGAALMIWGVKSNVIPVPEDRLAFVRARFALTRVSSVADIISLMRRTPNHRRALAEVSIPKLVAVGEHDLWPRSVHGDFAEAIGARLAVYATGHSPCETTPHQLTRDMLEAIETN